MGEQVSGNWRKSAYSGNGETCVEVGTDNAVLVRDTTDRDGGTLALSAEAWRGFTAAIR